MEGVNELNGPKIIPLVDPDTGEELKLTKDGTFQNLRTKAEFIVNDSGFIISLTDSVAKEKEHIENNSLVNDDTEKKYPINEKREALLQQQPQKPQQVKEQKQQPQPVVQQKIKPAIKQIPLEVIYKDYVNRYLNLVYQEKGVILEFVFDKTNAHCESSAISNNKLIYKTNFQNLEKFKNNVLLTIVGEFIKNSEEVVYGEEKNNLILKNKDTDEIRFINIKEDLINKIKQYEVIEYDEKLEVFKFYLVTITITLLIILCVLGIVLVLG